jgi:hypothetical protein
MAHLRIPKEQWKEKGAYSVIVTSSRMDELEV